jgi:hypothetical protein
MNSRSGVSRRKSLDDRVRKQSGLVAFNRIKRTEGVGAAGRTVRFSPRAWVSSAAFRVEIRFEIKIVAPRRTKADFDPESEVIIENLQNFSTDRTFSNRLESPDRRSSSDQVSDIISTSGNANKSVCGINGL